MELGGRGGGMLPELGGRGMPGLGGPGIPGGLGTFEGP
jgi:hypothetical protein